MSYRQLSSTRSKLYLLSSILLPNLFRPFLSCPPHYRHISHNQTPSCSGHKILGPFFTFYTPLTPPQPSTALLPTFSWSADPLTPFLDYLLKWLVLLYSYYRLSSHSYHPSSRFLKQVSNLFPSPNWSSTLLYFINTKLMILFSCFKTCSNYHFNYPTLWSLINDIHANIFREECSEICNLL